MARESAFHRPQGGQLQIRPIEARLAELAGLQHGVVGRSQLVRLGLSKDEIDGRVARGYLQLVHRGVYAVGHPVDSRRGWWMAAVLASAPGAVLSHRSAAALWGLRGYGGIAEVTLPRKSRSSALVRRHSSILPADEITEHHRIRVTTVPRTIFDLAAVLPPEAVESMLRESEYLRLHDPLSLPHLLDRYPRRRGSAKVRKALARRGETTGRVLRGLEERFVAFLDRHALARPHFNAPIEAAGKTYIVDCLWLPQREIVELDSWEAHGTRTVFRTDRTRDRRLRVAGYGITRLTWSQLEEEPDVIAADLRSLLSAPGSEP